jgi:23S rRNA pseudouridine2604 synthase
MALIDGQIKLNEIIVYENEIVGPYSKISYQDILVQSPDFYAYFAYYKPVGIECTLNTEIQDNLVQALPSSESDLFYVGRLDKKSEGLLLLTNDGHLYNKIISPNKEISKEYEVVVESAIDEQFIQNMQSGVFILNQQTKPCKVTRLSDYSFIIELTQGLNRQIRRMCFALGNYVVSLKRTKIGEISLKNLTSGELKKLNEDEIYYLRNLE